MKKYSSEEINEIKEKLKSEFTYWYHKIDLGQGIVKLEHPLAKNKDMVG